MDFSDLEYLTKCEQCGCVFDYVLAIRDKKDGETHQTSVCPACKHEYQLPNKNNF